MLTVVPGVDDGGDDSGGGASGGASLIDGIVRDGARRMLAAALQAEVEFDLRVEAPGPGSEIDADLVLVSNNVYRVERLSGFETRARLDEGVNSQSFPTARRGA